MTPALQQKAAKVSKASSICAAPRRDTRLSMSEARLRKHADYQRVYKLSRKHFSPSMSYFFCLRTEDAAPECDLGPRIGLTAGRVVGKAVERNRIKRRMREAVRHHVSELQHGVDVVLHPRRSVLTVDFAKLNAEVGRIFTVIRRNLEAESTAERVPPDSGVSGPAIRERT